MFSFEEKYQVHEEDCTRRKGERRRTGKTERMKIKTEKWVEKENVTKTKKKNRAVGEG